MNYCEIELEFQFVDLTTKKLVYGPFTNTDTTLSTLSTRIKELNANDNYDWTNFVNENDSPIMPGGQGYPNVPIVNAAIVARSEQELNLNES